MSLCHAEYSMITNPIDPISREEARSALEEIDRVGIQVRRSIAAGSMASMLMLWGAIWIVGFSAEQFLARAYRLWLVLDLVGLAVTFFLVSRKSPIKGPSYGRIWISWLALFGYAAFWCWLLVPQGMAHGPEWVAYGPVLERKIAVLWVTVCMFAYVVMGLWLDRFLSWLGAIITVATLVAFQFAPDYFYLWIGIGGGGALVASGAFIWRYWR
jgi:hypothetical protein